MAKATYCPARNGVWRCTLWSQHTESEHVDGRGRRWTDEPAISRSDAVQGVRTAQAALQMAIASLAPVCDHPTLRAQRLGIVLRDLRAHGAQLETAECWLMAAPEAADHTEQGDAG